MKTFQEYLEMAVRHGGKIISPKPQSMEGINATVDAIIKHGKGLTKKDVLNTETDEKDEFHFLISIMKSPDEFELEMTDVIKDVEKKTGRKMKYKYNKDTEEIVELDIKLKK